MREYCPNKWLIIQFKQEQDTWYRILGSWRGGYLDGDSWRLSSGLESVEDGGKYFLMKNVSGSVYKCYKLGEGITGYSASVLDDLQRQGEKNGIEIVPITFEEYENRADV